MTRLIDADALKKVIFSKSDSMEDLWDTAGVLNAINIAPTVEPTIKPICEVKFDHEQLKEIVDKAIIRCQNCKHQKKYWYEDKRMKEKGYWIYGCDLIDDHFVGTPVWGADNQFCSSAEAKKNE